MSIGLMDFVAHGFVDEGWVGRGLGEGGGEEGEALEVEDLGGGKLSPYVNGGRKRHTARKGRDEVMFVCG